MAFRLTKQEDARKSGLEAPTVDIEIPDAHNTLAGLPFEMDQ